MAVNLKLERSLVEVVGGQEVILETLNHSPTEPIFRQNGYEVNGDKKSFALEFDAANSEYVQIDNDYGIITSSDLSFYVDFEYDDSTPEKTILQVGSTSGETILLRQRATNRALLVITGSLGQKSVNINGLSNGRHTIEVIGLNIYLNGVLATAIVEYGTVTLDYVSYPLLISAGESGANFRNGAVYGFSFQGELYNLTEGLGNQVYGSGGTIGTIKTSHADGTLRTNFGQWLKGDDTNGWFSYTV